MLLQCKLRKALIATGTCELQWNTSHFDPPTNLKL